MLRMS
jgi:hypothetical protein